MRLPDDRLDEWWTLVAQQPRPTDEPMNAKLELARFIVRRSHGDDAAREAEDHFTRVVRRHEAPEDVPEEPLPDGDPIHLPALLANGMGVGSTSEARRLIGQGAVKVDGDVVTELDLPRDKLDGALVQAGKRRFRRFKAV
jgi:tyrosyl-tRNA synthetase